MDVEEWVEERPDFTAQLEFLQPEVGGRSNPPAQGYRCDFSYANDPPTRAWMIYPSFLDASGRPLPHGARVPSRVQANMRILDPDLRRTEHRGRLDIGTEFRLVEGSRVVAVGRVQVLLRLGED